MTEQRKTAIIVGILFIIATVLFMVGQFIHGPIFGYPDELFLLEGAAVRAGVWIELAGVLAIPLIATYLYPILKEQDEGMALSYVALRGMEGMLMVLVSVAMLAKWEISEDVAAELPPATEHWEPMLSTIEAMSGSAFLMSVAIIFPIGALLLNKMLWQSQLVPKPIAGWGLIAAALLLMGSLANLLGLLPGVSDAVLGATLPLPIAVQEMVLATWLIAKGFDLSFLKTEGA